MKRSVQSLHRKPFIILNLYRPPGGDMNRALGILGDMLNKLRDKFSHECIVMGDVNVNFLKKKDHVTNKWNQLFRRCNINMTFWDSTRDTIRSKSMIDIIATDIKNVCMSGTLNYNCSDHKPVFLCIKKLKKSNKFKHVNKVIAIHRACHLNKDPFIDDTKNLLNLIPGVSTIELKDECGFNGFDNLNADSKIKSLKLINTAIERNADMIISTSPYCTSHTVN